MHNGKVVSLPLPACLHFLFSKLLDLLRWNLVLGIYTKNCQSSLILIRISHKQWRILHLCRRCNELEPTLQGGPLTTKLLFVCQRHMGCGCLVVTHYVKIMPLVKNNPYFNGTRTKFNRVSQNTCTKLIPKRHQIQTCLQYTFSTWWIFNKIQGK
jgi:hypothetical protein